MPPRRRTDPDAGLAAARPPGAPTREGVDRATRGHRRALHARGARGPRPGTQRRGARAAVRCGAVRRGPAAHPRHPAQRRRVRRRDLAAAGHRRPALGARPRRTAGCGSAAPAPTSTALLPLTEPVPERPRGPRHDDAPASGTASSSSPSMPLARGGPALGRRRADGLRPRLDLRPPRVGRPARLARGSPLAPTLAARLHGHLDDRPRDVRVVAQLPPPLRAGARRPSPSTTLSGGRFLLGLGTGGDLDAGSSARTARSRSGSTGSTSSPAARPAAARGPRRPRRRVLRHARRPHPSRAGARARAARHRGQRPPVGARWPPGSVTRGSTYGGKGDTRRRVVRPRRRAWSDALRRRVRRTPGAAPLDRYLLLDASPRYSLESVDLYAEMIGRAAELGFTDVVTHWPRPDGPYAGDVAVLEAVAATSSAPDRRCTPHRVPGMRVRAGPRVRRGRGRPPGRSSGCAEPPAGSTVIADRGGGVRRRPARSTLTRPVGVGVEQPGRAWPRRSAPTYQSW